MAFTFVFGTKIALDSVMCHDLVLRSFDSGQGHILHLIKFLNKSILGLRFYMWGMFFSVIVLYPLYPREPPKKAYY